MQISFENEEMVIDNAAMGTISSLHATGQDTVEKQIRVFSLKNILLVSYLFMNTRPTAGQCYVRWYP